MNVKERVLLIASLSSLSKHDFFGKLGVTYGNFTGANKKTPLNSSILSKLVMDFGIDAHWLLTGEGYPQGVKLLMGAENQIAFLEQEEAFLKEQYQHTQNYLDALGKRQKSLSGLKKQLKE